MKGGIKSAGIFLALLAGMAHADDAVQEIILPDAPVFQENGYKPGGVAENDGGSNASRNVASAAPPRQAEFREPLLSLNKTHEYLGIATIISAGLTMLTAPDNECEQGCTAAATPQTSGTHQSLGRATRTLALAAVVTGIAAHWDDMHLFDDGLKDPDTQHWLLAGSGALLLADAVRRAPARSHSGEAELGAAAMLVAIKLVW
jgi:hypothetical protein